MRPARRLDVDLDQTLVELIDRSVSFDVVQRKQKAPVDTRGFPSREDGQKLN
ncbi:hypothetical protein SDC9_134958 [bioreactor metagenome]|uniref:Uncharacterized protein n=1 Tax=bioreactor metagenome TaxID=1076179 RepID=A0A645DFQ3_9ZZZZ